MSDAEIARLRELAAKAKQAEAECLISEERSPGGTVTRIYKHPCSPESSRSVLADSAFSEALVSAWPSLLSRIEAADAMEEALKNVASSYAAFGDSCWCDGVSGEHNGHDSDCVAARAALAEYAKQKGVS